MQSAVFNSIILLSNYAREYREMSKLISGKEALESILNGIDVQYLNPFNQWDDSAIAISVMDFLDCKFKFRLKPRTITINGIEVPVPFNGELGHKQYAYVLNTASPDGYSHIKFYEGNAKPLACWICEDEIKQVVSALRSVFKPQ